MSPFNDQNFNKELRLPEEDVAREINDLKIRCNELDEGMKVIRERQFVMSKMQMEQLDMIVNFIKQDQGYNKWIRHALGLMAVINILMACVSFGAMTS